jgi:hypothetical protein
VFGQVKADVPVGRLAEGLEDGGLATSHAFAHVAHSECRFKSRSRMRDRYMARSCRKVSRGTHCGGLETSPKSGIANNLTFPTCPEPKDEVSSGWLRLNLLPNSNL